MSARTMSVIDDFKKERIGLLKIARFARVDVVPFKLMFVTARQFFRFSPRYP